MTASAHIDLLNDIAGLAVIVWLMADESPRWRRLGVLLVILSGVDGLLKMRFLLSASTVELAYQVPWIMAGIYACGWLRDPPRIGASV